MMLIVVVALMCRVLLHRISFLKSVMGYHKPPPVGEACIQKYLAKISIWAQNVINLPPMCQPGIPGCVGMGEKRRITPTPTELAIPTRVGNTVPVLPLTGPPCPCTQVQAVCRELAAWLVSALLVRAAIERAAGVAWPQTPQPRTLRGGRGIWLRPWCSCSRYRTESQRAGGPAQQMPPCPR